MDSIIHYKRNRYFLIGGSAQKKGLHQFATGYKEQPGREGTWRDAEDGLLEGNTIAQGSVDSAVSFELDLLPNSVGSVHYWIVCARSLKQVLDLTLKVKEIGAEQLLMETENYLGCLAEQEEHQPCQPAQEHPWLPTRTRFSSCAPMPTAREG